MAVLIGLLVVDRLQRRKSQLPPGFRHRPWRGSFPPRLRQGQLACGLGQCRALHRFRSHVRGHDDRLREGEGGGGAFGPDR